MTDLKNFVTVCDDEMMDVDGGNIIQGDGDRRGNVNAYGSAPYDAREVVSAMGDIANAVVALACPKVGLGIFIGRRILGCSSN